LTVGSGPRPEEFTFPFAEARAALVAIDDAVAALRELVDVHERAVAEVRVGFAGQTRVGFDRGFDDLIGRVRASASALEAQRDELEADLATARRRREQQLDAIAAWERAVAP